MRHTARWNILNKSFRDVSWWCKVRVRAYLHDLVSRVSERGVRIASVLLERRAGSEWRGAAPWRGWRGDAGRDRGHAGRLPIDLPLGLLHPGAPIHSALSPVRIFTPPPLKSARSLYLRLGKIYYFSGNSRISSSMIRRQSFCFEMQITFE